MRPILSTARALHDKTLSARALLEEHLARIDAQDGEGACTFMTVHRDNARAQADAIDAARSSGHDPGRFAGIAFSTKDLFDEAGQTTRAASRVLARPADQDAPAIAALKNAGLISVGRTVMTEFAFSGVGINPHYGTPANPYDRANRRISGGSSSGAVISVTDGMASIGTGSDTGGSCRIPAALCGIVGVKPTQSLISRQGTIPLSKTLDTVGVMAPTVACAQIATELMAGKTPALDAVPMADLRSLRLGVLSDYVTDDMDDIVAATWEAALRRLEQAGATLEACPFPELRTIPQINARGGFAAAEALAWHRDLITQRPDDYDPFVLKRILRGHEQSAIDYIDLLNARAALIDTARSRLDRFDAVLMPTVPIIAPLIAALSADDAAHTAANLRLLRNTTVVNMLDRCAISLPCHRQGSAPVGLSLIGPNGGDQALFAAARAVENAFS